MIQRIQSIFLLVVGLCLIIFLFAPIWEKQDVNSGQSYSQTAFYVEKVATIESEIALIFNSLAIRFIRKDEKLVRSMDRLR
jgi:hypothetical protein